MKILALTNMFPSAKRPASGTFVKQQIDSLIDIGVNVEVLFIDRAENGMKSYWNLAKTLRATVNESQPDIVHIMYGGIMADIATRAVNGLPKIVTFHGSDLLGENLSGITRMIISQIGVKASFNAAARANRVVVVSEQLRKILLGKIESSRISIIPCGINLSQFVPLDHDTCCRTLGWRSDTFHVLFPANSGDPVKRPELAKAAVEKLRVQGMPIELHMLSGVPYSEVPLWINASDVLLLTSLHEGSPTVVKEALACNLPIVSVDVGDVAERILNIGGSYLSSADPDDLARYLRIVYTSRCRLSSRQSMEALSSENIAVRLRSLYQELLS